MESFFSKDWTGAPFTLFGTAHLVGIAIIVITNLALIFFGKRLSPSARIVFRYSLAAILLIDEAGWHYWNWHIGQWTVQTMLPLHICSVFVFLCAYMLVSRNYRIYEFAYFLGIGGAMQAILTPDAGMYGFPHFRFFQVLISHGAIVTSAIYLTCVEGFRPVPRSLPRVLIGANLYMLVIGIVNVLIGSNYLYIAHKPATPSLIDLLGPWPWYILGMEVIGITVMLLLYLPFLLYDRMQSPRPDRLAA